MTAKKAAKAAEREAKQAARGVVNKPTWGEPKKDKKEKAKIEGVSVTEWVNPTPEGEKKGKLWVSPHGAKLIRRRLWGYACYWI
jgi:hypothetical protein